MEDKILMVRHDGDVMRWNWPDYAPEGASSGSHTLRFREKAGRVDNLKIRYLDLNS